MKEVYIIKQGYFNFNHHVEHLKDIPMISDDAIAGSHCFSNKERANKIITRLNDQDNFNRKRNGFYAYVVSMKVK